MISKSREKTRELNSTQIHSFISELQAEVLPTYIGLNIQQKSMKNNAKQLAKWKRGGDQKVSKYKSKSKKLSALFGPLPFSIWPVVLAVFFIGFC